jgi:hypothetical protein
MTEPANRLPPVLYKYYPPERIADVLENFTIRLSSPSAFNDAFDSRSVASETNYRKGSALKSLRRTRLGIFCLAEDPDNHLMWVNYAAQHRGFVVGFNTSDEFFSSNMLTPRRVIYVSEPVPVDQENELSVERALIKSADWRYEREWRCVREFASSESRDLMFLPTAIFHLILGWRMESFHVSQILSALDVINHSPECQVEVSESRPDMHTWTFTHHPTKKVLCQCCNGIGYVVSKATAQSEPR